MDTNRTTEPQPFAIREIIVMTLVIPMALLFSAAGVNKLWGHAAFREGLMHSPMLPDRAAPFLSVVIPIMLLVIAGILIIGFWSRIWMAIGLWAYLTIMILFTAYIILMLNLFPIELPCTCLGIYDRWRLSWQQHLGLNVAILVYTAITLLTFYAKRLKIFVATDGAEAGGSLKKEGKTLYN